VPALFFTPRRIGAVDAIDACPYTEETDAACPYTEETDAAAIALP
jgi:hypothetical protein